MVKSKSNITEFIENVFESSETKTALNECYRHEHYPCTEMLEDIHTSGLCYANTICERKQTKHENKYGTENVKKICPLSVSVGET